MDDETGWITEDAALERLAAEFDTIPAGKIEAQYHLAVSSGNVRLSALILGTIAEWKRVTLSDDLTRALYLRVEWSDLVAQVREQLGEPLLSPERDTPPSIRTNRAASAEEACKEWLGRQSPTERLLKDEALKAARVAVQSTGPLSEKAFDRAWRAAAPDEWKRQGRPPKKTPAQEKQNPV